MKRMEEIAVTEKKADHLRAALRMRRAARWGEIPGGGWHPVRARASFRLTCELEFNTREIVPKYRHLRPGLPRDRLFVGTASIIDLVFSGPGFLVQFRRR